MGERNEPNMGYWEHKRIMAHPRMRRIGPQHPTPELHPEFFDEGTVAPSPVIADPMLIASPDAPRRAEFRILDALLGHIEAKGGSLFEVKSNSAIADDHNLEPTHNYGDLAEQMAIFLQDLINPFDEFVYDYRAAELLPIQFIPSEFKVTPHILFNIDPSIDAYMPVTELKETSAKHVSADQVIVTRELRPGDQIKALIHWHHSHEDKPSGATGMRLGEINSTFKESGFGTWEFTPYCKLAVKLASQPGWSETKGFQDAVDNLGACLTTTLGVRNAS